VKNLGLGAIERERHERRFMAAISAWYAVTDGTSPLPNALSEICSAFDADAAGVSRYGRRVGDAPRFISYDRRPPGAFVPRLSRAYTHCVLGEFARRARSGTVWQSSMVSDLDPAITTFQSRRALRELIVCPLGCGEEGHDYLEVHFDREVAGELLARIETLAFSLQRAWSERAPGSFFERLVASRPTIGGDDRINLLDFANPAGLSRAEYRVCLLLSQGLSNESIQRELGIAEATLRTHLRNVYGKAGVENKAELVYKLLAAEKPSPQRARSSV